MSEDVTFVQLRTFACVAKTGSFALAAEQLDITQPSVSEQIKALEDRLGCLLFRRRRGTTPTLTAEGEEALEQVEAILGANNQLFEIGKKSASKTVLSISVGPYLRENYVRKIIPRIYREYPNVEVDLQPLGTPAEVTRQMESGELDLAVYAESVQADLQPYTRKVCELATVMIAPAGTRARLTSGERSLDDYRFIFPGHRNIGARWARQRLRAMNVTPRLPTMFIEFIDALAQMVEDGQGIGPTMEYAVAESIAAGRVEALDIPLPPIRRLVARSPHAPEVAQAIEDMLCEVLTVSR